MFAFAVPSINKPYTYRLDFCCIRHEWLYLCCGVV